jgi:hypothetical protein
MIETLMAVVVGAFLGALLPPLVQKIMTPNPNLSISLRVWKAELPYYSVQSHHSVSKPVSGSVLIAEVRNSINAKANAENCRAKLEIEGVTNGEEYIPWRYLELATGRGSSWTQFHSIRILRGDNRTTSHLLDRKRRGQWFSSDIIT